MTNPDERRRAGRAVSARIDEMHSTFAAVARAAGVSRSTVRDLARGERWPREESRQRIAAAIGWPEGEIDRYVSPVDPAYLDRAPLIDLAEALCRRITRRTT